MSMEKLLRESIKERKKYVPKGQGLPLNDEDLDKLYQEWKAKKGEKK